MRQQARGTLDHVIGTIRETAGKLTGDRRTEIGGKAQQIRGQAYRLLGRSLPKLDRHYARAEEGSRLKLADARAAGVVAPTVLAVALTWVLGQVSTKMLPRTMSAALLVGMLGLIAMTVDASRRARA